MYVGNIIKIDQGEAFRIQRKLTSKYMRETLGRLADLNRRCKDSIVHEKKRSFRLS